jgi:hypothetical protein
MTTSVAYNLFAVSVTETTMKKHFDKYVFIYMDCYSDIL